MANAFWECELYDELLHNSISHMWSFTSKKREDGLSGTKDDAVEYIAQYSEWTVGSLSSVTCPPMFMQFTGCHQPLQSFYWPENAID